MIMRNLEKSDPLAEIANRVQQIMTRLLRMRPEPQKTAPKAATPKGEAQRRRRENERQRPTAASGGGLEI